jgi:hypothetical protein
MFSEARLRLSYAPSEFLQAAGCILELATSSHSHTNAHMDNTLICKHIQKHKSIYFINRKYYALYHFEVENLTQSF